MANFLQFFLIEKNYKVNNKSFTVIRSVVVWLWFGPLLFFSSFFCRNVENRRNNIFKVQIYPYFFLNNITFVLVYYFYKCSEQYCNSYTMSQRLHLPLANDKDLWLCYDAVIYIFVFYFSPVHIHLSHFGSHNSKTEWLSWIIVW